MKNNSHCERRRSNLFQIAASAFGFLAMTMTATPAFANNLVISNVTLEDRNPSANTLVVQFDISWDHSWRKADGRHDAAWVFVKILDSSTPPWVHGILYTAGTNPPTTSPGTNPDVKIVIPSDKIGAFISRQATGNGAFSSKKVRLTVDYGTSGIADTDTIQVKVFGVEMAYVPEGPFYLGDGDNPNADEAVRTSIYSSDDLYISVFNSSGTFQWAKRLGGTSTDWGQAITSDSANNIIAAGFVSGNADLNGDGDTADTNESIGGIHGNNDAFISSFNSAGIFQWSKRLGGVGNDIIHGIAVNSANNIIVTGKITGSADLNGDGDTADSNESSGGIYGLGDNGFISVFNSAGTFQWSERLGGTTGVVNYGVSTDSANNVIVAGFVWGNADLNGDGDTADSNEATGGVYSVRDVFVSSFNSSGTFLWSERLGGTATDYGYSVATDSVNNVIVTGYVTGNADLNGDGDTADTNESTGGVYSGEDIFISVFNSAGTFQWSKRLGGTVTDSGQSIKADSAKNVIVVGTVHGRGDLNGDGDTADTNENTGGVYSAQDPFISVFDSIGTFLWTKRLGGLNTDYGYGVATDGSNNIVVTGVASRTADLNGDADTADSNETGHTGVYASEDPFISVFSSAGIFQWSKRLGGTGTDVGLGLTADSARNVIATGYIPGNTDLNGDAAILTTYSFYEVGDDDSAVQITTTGKVVTVDTNSGDDIDTTPITVTGLAGITGNTSWPNGYAAFYLMKYEITQGQYVDFLNTLTRVQQGRRVESTVSANTIANYYVMLSSTAVPNDFGVSGNYRNTVRAPASGNGTTPTPIVFGNDYNGNGVFNETDDGKNIAMNYITPPDVAAYADWAGLRPYTEFEYEKAARGPNPAVFGEYAWGSTKTTTYTSIMNAGRNDEVVNTTGEGLSTDDLADIGPVRVGFAATNSTNRKSAAAGYYGHHGLTGGLYEQQVYIWDSEGRAFAGTHGDGTLTSVASFEGNATNNDWPGIAATTSRGVIDFDYWTYRGGVYYLLQTVADRTETGVFDNVRGAAFGGRLGRTAP